MTVIELEPVDYFCPHCDSATEWTGCRAPHCPGFYCRNCGRGCDLIEESDQGRCVAALAALPYPQAQDLRDERQLSIRYRRPIRTVRLPGDCA